MFDLVMKTIGIAAAGMLALLVLATPAMASDHDMGAFIREGSCDQPGKVVEDIGDLDPEDDIWQVVGKGETRPAILYGEDEGISQSIDDLTGAGYIVTIHATDDAKADVVACGKIEGTADSEGTLVIELQEVADSGFAGRVRFDPSSDHDENEQTEVTTGVWASTSNATPAATPAG